jgi:type II secretory pathway pseudopilin PulG
MRRQEYAAIGVLAALILVAWYFETSKEKERQDARATEQVQQQQQSSAAK